MHLRKALLESGNQVEKILKWQIGMQSADDMELGNCFAVSRGRSLECFFESHGVSAVRVFFSAERTEPASGYAGICGINVAIDVEVGLVTVHALAHGIRQPADRENVCGAVERERVFGIQTLLGDNLTFDGIKPTVVDLKGVTR